MDFIRGRPQNPAAVGLLPGAFNPPTIAHVALIEAAAGQVDQVVCVLPREFPHKQYEGARLEQRLQMLDRLAASAHPFLVAVADGGLFIDMARECRAALGSSVDVAFLCGRDAAERIIAWDYGRPGAIEAMMQEFRLLVADRGGRFDPPADLARRCARLHVPFDVDSVSSTEVRSRIAGGESWRDLVPHAIRDLAEEVYGARML